MEYIIFEDGKKVSDMNSIVIWSGLFSNADKNGEMMNYLNNHLPKNSVCLIPKSDGNLCKNQDNSNQWNDFDWNIIEQFIKYANNKKKVFILVTLCQIKEEPNVNYLYLPLDDIFFKFGVNKFFPKEQCPDWDQKSDILCWRGSCSGINGSDSIRVKFVKKIQEYSKITGINNDVKLSYQWKEDKDIDDELFGERYNYEEFLKYKIFFIVDGNCISSNYMWGFATMCVPVMITNAKCWFSQYIIPYVHYIPIKYDLSDLFEKLDWIKNNDNIARRIAENARDFSRIFFSADFQQNYVKNQLDKFTYEQII